LSVKFALKRFKIKDFKFNNVPVSTAYTFILFGMIHFIILGTNLIALQKVQWFNWGIFVGLGLDGTIQLEMTAVLMWIDAGLTFYGVYLLKHLEPEKKKQDKQTDHDYGKSDYKGKDNLK